MSCGCPPSVHSLARSPGMPSEKAAREFELESRPLNSLGQIPQALRPEQYTQIEQVPKPRPQQPSSQRDCESDQPSCINCENVYYSDEVLSPKKESSSAYRHPRSSQRTSPYAKDCVEVGCQDATQRVSYNRDLWPEDAGSVPARQSILRADMQPMNVGEGIGTRCHDCPCWKAHDPAPPPSLATGDIYRTCGLPKRFQHPSWFTGYNSGPKHPLYRTTASEIGRYPPTVHTVPTIYRPTDRTFSKIYVPAGPWRNRGFCTTGSIWDAYQYYYD